MTSSHHARLAELEHQILPAGGDGALRPPLVFLHEGLGSVSRWKDFPLKVHKACGHPAALVYSRYGYGRSPARPASSARTWMEEEATVVLPQLLEELGFHPAVLIGHSDGATIAALHAAAGWPVAGLALIAPHLFLEPCTVAGVRSAHHEFRDGARLRRLARHHDDPRFVVARWCDAWLADDMHDWTIEPQLSRIRASVLVVQGTKDAYGTTAQVDAVRRSCAGPVEALVLDGVGHEPHFEAAEKTVDAVAGFVQRVAPLITGDAVRG